MTDNIDPSEWYDEDMPPVYNNWVYKDQPKKEREMDYDEMDYEVERVYPKLGF